MLIIIKLVKLHSSRNLLYFFHAQNGMKFLIEYSLNILYRSVKSQLLLKRYTLSDRNRFPSLPSFMAIKFKPQSRAHCHHFSVSGSAGYLSRFSLLTSPLVFPFRHATRWRGTWRTSRSYNRTKNSPRNWTQRPGTSSEHHRSHGRRPPEQAHNSTPQSKWRCVISCCLQAISLLSNYPRERIFLFKI